MTCIGTNIFSVLWCDGVYLSTDYGDTWTKKSQGITSDYPGTISAKGNNLFLCTGDGMFMSTDLGESWVEKNNGLTIKDVRSITINDDKIFIGLQAGGVYLSTNDGEMWIKKSNGLVDGANWGYLLASYQNTIFLGTLQRGFFISSDIGENWVLSNYGLGGNAIGTIATDDIYVYAGTDMGAFRARLEDMITDVDEIQTESELFVLPNPASDYITISGISGNIKIFDIMGREVWGGFITEGERISVKDLNAGIYYIKAEGEMLTKKFVIMK
ncbi:T9SS C-terminal target domain-containing protein [Bacteroidetes/Chlorobi group bacterium ChocPot_Mid]|nr:MAG: T9SS C-terminal target domain-containing protein [Bacteroidetes/Chlorobi group bacterium ChocPot_Mid]